MSTPNYNLAAVRLGELFKNHSTLNEIGRMAGATFAFSRDTFPNESITSSRAKAVYDWILTLANQRMDSDARNHLLISFARSVGAESHRAEVDRILEESGVRGSTLDRDAVSEFSTRGFHPEVIRHARQLFVDGHFFHAVFEVAKAYNNLVREKSRSTRDGTALMLEVWGWEKGVLKVTACRTHTDKDVQDGIKFLSAGLMQAVRNPTSHEPAVEWPITKVDCLDLLGFMSFLLRKLDNAVYVAV